MRYPLSVWTPEDADYPYRLQSCPDKPNPLYVRGNIPLKSKHVVSIVGTRRPTERGKENKGYSASIFCNNVGPEGGRDLVEETLNMLEKVSK